jgi:lysozyme family protein
MDRNFQRALSRVLKHEGGFANHKDDPGGATNRGVTLATFRAYVKADGTVADLKRITDEQVSTVYYRHYWAAVNAQALPAGIDYAVFDFAVNSGPKRAAQYLQGVLGVEKDGRVGPKTIAAAKAADHAAVIDELCDRRMAFLKRLAGWKTFGKGWTGRVADVRKTALSWVGKPADVEVIPVPVPKPTVPKAVENEVKQKTNLWGWIVGLGTSAGAGVGKILDAEWSTVLAIGGVGIVAIGAGLLMRHQIIAAVKDIRQAVEQG